MVASGDATNEPSYRIFIFGQVNVIKFLGELTVEKRKRRISLKIKSNELSKVPLFLQCLQLDTLFGL